METPQNTVSGILGVVFDMDGTLVASDLDFQSIRAEARVPNETPILEYLDSAEDPDRERARQVLLEHEERAARTCRLFPGVPGVLNALRRSGYRLALLTRNSRDSVDRVLGRFGLRFDVSLSREEATPKPSPRPVLKIADRLGVSPAALLVVGDYLFDVQAGRAAGARTALLRSERTAPFLHRADLVLDALTELLDYLPTANPELMETP